MLPIDIQMQIDITAAAHVREIAEGFAAARARLLPEPIPRKQMTWEEWNGCYLLGVDAYGVEQMLNMHPPRWSQQRQTGQYDPFGSPLGPASTGLLGALGL